jgi:phage replication-related protein YjqB (UPF0714/DUF867 family)
VADLYTSMQDLKSKTKEGTDWKITKIDKCSRSLVSAIHGGSIEGGTTELAQLIAEKTNADFFTFEGIRSSNNGDLHVTSTNYNEPTFNKMTGRVLNHIAVHGASGTDSKVLIGGLDIELRDKIGASLTSAGFVVEVAPDAIDGQEPDNYSNHTLKNGCVQLELTSALRQSFFKANDFASANRGRENWTETMYKFADAVAKHITMGV